MLTPKIDISKACVNINNLYKQTKELNSLPLENSPPPSQISGSNSSSQRSILIPNNPIDITGGYLLEQDILERYILEPSGFITNSGQAITVNSPKYASKEQVAYISNYFQEMEDALISDSGINPHTGKHYSEYIDIDSWAKKYIIEEVTKNFDIGISSSFFYKPSGVDSKLYAGPLWDYDGGFAYWEGEHNGTIMHKPDDLIAHKYHESNNGTQYFYYAYRQKEFRDTVIATYQNTFLPILKNYSF